MIDTIEIVQDFDSVKELEACIQILEKKYIIDKSTTVSNDNLKPIKTFYTCWDKGFKIWIIQNKIYLQGSLTKLYFGNNYQTLNSRQLIKAYEKLKARYFFINWNKAIHKRIDLGVSFRLSTPPSFTIRKIIGGKRMKKTVYKSNGESVIIGNNSNQIIFYDQTESCNKELSKNSNIKTIPDNLLRIEYKMLKLHTIERHFGSKNITIDYILTNMHFLPKIWYSMYCNAEKDYSTNIGLFSNKKEMEIKAIIHYGIESLKNELVDSYKSKRLTRSTKQNIQNYLGDILSYQSEYTKSLNSMKILDNRAERFANCNSFIRANISV
ncbi:hypothetical protein ACFPMF_15195 [Larkinella bovis]|uniref:Replication-associated protein G2P N-terminal domain-containing protein n=1 Tax=Larkinella bovis TaxID=683041 RepID=A0ABW0IEX4_9BACT